MERSPSTAATAATAHRVARAASLVVALGGAAATAAFAGAPAATVPARTVAPPLSVPALGVPAPDAGGTDAVPPDAASPDAAARTLPAAVVQALQRAQLPAESLGVWVAEAGAAPSRGLQLAHLPDRPLNPASVMKLYTTGAALDLLGPAWTWTTPVYAVGNVTADGVLHGDLTVQGRGDPTLAVERVWLLLRQVQQRGIRTIAGDLVLDGSLFAPFEGEAAQPGDFDGERFRPYNVVPDGLLLNLKSLTLTFVPDLARGVARVASDVPLAGVTVEPSVPLTGGECGDWRAALRPDFNDPNRVRLAGGYAAACGERTWPIAYADPRSYNARLLQGLWRELGGRLGGRVREGRAPDGVAPFAESVSASLPSVVRDINKFSNNVMAQQLFLTLGRQVPLPVLQPEAPRPVDTTAAARALLAATVRERTGCVAPDVVVDNGSGLSRASRSTPRCLGTWLQALYAGPTMPELMSSLPVTGVDGTARRPGRAWGAAQGRAHLKTGSLRDAMALAGYVLGTSGRRYVFVALVNHPNAGAARPVLDALVQWTADDAARCCLR